jgi:hypothetical protein
MDNFFAVATSDLATAIVAVHGVKDLSHVSIGQLSRINRLGLPGQIYTAVLDKHCAILFVKFMLLAIPANY